MTTSKNKTTENALTDFYDCIVIGAGLGALTAGAIETKRGKRVLVLEKHKILGGYASIFGRDSYKFDVSLHQIGGVRKTRLRAILQQAGVYEKLDFVKTPTLIKLRIDEQTEDISIPNGDMDAFARELLERFPKDRKAIRLWFWVMKRIGRQIGHFDRIRSLNPLLQSLLLFAMPVFAPVLIVVSLFRPRLSLVLRTRNEKLRKILLHFSGYYGLDADRINLLFPMAGNYSYYSDGGYYVKGGGYNIVKQLALVIRKNGGEIMTGQEVEKIHTEGNRITGVSVKGKSDVYKSNQLICGANPYIVYDKMLSHHPRAQNELTRLRKMTPGMTGSVIYLKIDVKPEVLNPDMANTYEFVKPPEKSEPDFYHHFMNRMDFENTYKEDGITITFHSFADPASLKGREGALMDVFFCDNYERWAQLDPQEYKQQKEAEMDKMLDAVEQYLPGLRKHIEIVELATPLTMEKFTSNPKGALYGFAQSPEQSGNKRLAIKGVLNGLNFVSAWTRPGGGYEGVLRAADAYANPVSRTGVILFLLLILAILGLLKTLFA